MIHSKQEAFKQNERQIQSLLEYFNPEFYQKQLADCRKDINIRINSEENQFLNFVEKNAPKETSIGIYFGRYDNYSVRLEETKLLEIMNVKPNCVAIDQKLMVGSEAINYYQNSTKQKYTNFDIKSIFKRSLKFGERSLLPFEMNYHDTLIVARIDGLVHQLSVETLVAAQVLDIKRDVEKEVKAVVNSAVFTVPTHFSIKQKNAMKDVANIAGIDSVEILSEITAAALAYASDTNVNYKNGFNSVLFIAINGRKCDAAVCEITRNQIKYLSHFQHELTEDDINVIENTKGSPKYYNHIKGSFKTLIENFSIKIWIKNLQNIVIIGSNLTKEFEFYITHSKKFDKNIIYECDPIEIIVRGTAIYGNPLLRRNFDITEVSIYPLGLLVKSNNFSSSIMLLTHNNTPLPKIDSKRVNSKPGESNFPITVDIYQNIGRGYEKVDCFQVESLEEMFFNKNNHIIKSYSQYINTIVDAHGHVHVASLLISPDQKTRITLNVRKVTELSGQKISDQKVILETILRNNTPQTIMMNEPVHMEVAEEIVPPRPLTNLTKMDPSLDSARSELQSLYSDVEERLKKCDKMSSLLREAFEKQMSETSAVIQSNESNLNKLIDHKGFLEKLMLKTNRFVK